MKSDEEYAALSEENAKLRSALNSIGEYAAFTVRMFLGVENPKHLRETLENIAKDAKEAEQ